MVVREYLLFEFGSSAVGQYVLTFIFLTLLAAGMSTLDGILVSLSAMVINDIVTPIVGKLPSALMWSRVLLVAVGLVALALAWNPPALIGLFAQKGVYGLAAASAAPILFGVLYQGSIPKGLVLLAAFLGLTVHLILNLVGGVANPAVSATIAVFVSMTLIGVYLMSVRVRR